MNPKSKSLSWEEKFKKLFVDPEDGLMHDKYAEEEIVDFISQVRKEAVEEVLKDVEKFDASGFAHFGSAGASMVKSNMVDYLKSKLEELKDG